MISGARIAVIVPYFQRERGVLARSLRSVLAQDLTAGVHVSVVVVDDSSPISAQDEVAEVVVPGGIELRILRIPNGGPGAARNAGLDAVADSTDFIAFQDSDDTWTPDHLTNALTALTTGPADVYFANFFQIEQSVGAFERAGKLTSAEHRSLPGTSWLHFFEGDMRSQIIDGNVIGTPTIVYRRAAAADLRFDERFRRAGEDYLFWLEMADRGLRFVFSERCECVCGKGVNVFSGVEWGTAESLDRVIDEIVFRKEMLRRYEFQPAQALRLHQSIDALRDSYAFQLAGRIRRASADVRSVAKHVSRDPFLSVAIPWCMVKRIVLRRSAQ